MFYYDEEGDLAPTGDRQTKLKQHVTTMLRTGSFPLQPSAAGWLNEILGETDPDMGRKEARRRVRQALEEAGLDGVSMEVAVEALDNEWRAKIRVGEGD